MGRVGGVCAAVADVAEELLEGELGFFLVVLGLLLGLKIEFWYQSIGRLWLHYDWRTMIPVNPLDSPTPVC